MLKFNLFSCSVSILFFKFSSSSFNSSSLFNAMFFCFFNVMFNVFYHGAFLAKESDMVYIQVVHLTFPPYIFSISLKVWSMICHGSVRQVQNKIKNVLLYFHVLFWQFLLFFIKKFVVLS